VEKDRAGATCTEAECAVALRSVLVRTPENACVGIISRKGDPFSSSSGGSTKGTRVGVCGEEEGGVRGRGSEKDKVRRIQIKTKAIDHFRDPEAPKSATVVRQ